MNQILIEGLATHADFYVGNEHSGKSYEERDRLWVEKYTELVVREFMEMCDSEKADYFKHRKAAYDFEEKQIYAEGEAACDTLKIRAKRHFGVEK